MVGKRFEDCVSVKCDAECREASRWPHTARWVIGGAHAASLSVAGWRSAGCDVSVVPPDFPDRSLVRPGPERLERQESPCSAVVTSTPLGNARPWRVFVYLPHSNSRLQVKGLFVFPLPGCRVWGRKWRWRISPGNGGAGCAETVRGPHASPLRTLHLCADSFIVRDFTSAT